MYIFSELDQALDEEAWRQLSEEMPRIANGIQTAIQHGAEPVQVRNQVIRSTEDSKLASICERAARWLARGK